MFKSVCAALCLMMASPLAAQTPDLLLMTIDGADSGFDATMNVDEPGVLYGHAPCNRYSASLNGTLDAFTLGAILTTKMACPDLAAERMFFDLLQQMERAELLNGVLTLTGGGHAMVFSSLP